jgi:hypothetical protein
MAAGPANAGIRSPADSIPPTGLLISMSRAGFFGHRTGCPHAAVAEALPVADPRRGGSNASNRTAFLATGRPAHAVAGARFRRGRFVPSSWGRIGHLSFQIRRLLVIAETILRNRPVHFLNRLMIRRVREPPHFRRPLPSVPEVVLSLQLQPELRRSAQRRRQPQPACA